jgi:hypothetical protein
VRVVCSTVSAAITNEVIFLPSLLARQIAGMCIEYSFYTCVQVYFAKYLTFHRFFCSLRRLWYNQGMRHYRYSVLTKPDKYERVRKARGPLCRLRNVNFRAWRHNANKLRRANMMRATL